MSHSPSPEQLLADAAWLRRLAVTLADSEADADDLVQESWIAAWNSKPDSDRPLRPWLRKVVRDLAGMKRRSERRRVAREEATADRDAVASPPDALLDQMRLHRLLVDLVLALDEPYRTTVIARFVEGRTAASIARSSGIPESTVRGRLREGLARLRAQLDERQGDRKAWAPAVLALTKAGEAQPAHRIGQAAAGAIMKKVVIAVAVLVLAVPISLSVVGLKHESSTAKQTPANKQAAIIGHPRARADSDPAMREWLITRNAPARKVAGHVTFRGMPVKDAVVSLHSMLSRGNGIPPAEVRTDIDGSFDFGTRPPTGYTITAASPNTAAAIVQLNLADPTLAPPSDRLEIRLGECGAVVEGTIFDASGNALPHAHVQRSPPEQSGGLVGVESNESGQYRLCVPFGEVDVEYGSDGYGTILLTIDARGEVHRDVVLVPEATLAVRVVRSDDETPVANAYVLVGRDLGGPDRAATCRGVTDNDGRVQIAGLLPGRHLVFGRADGGLQSQGTIETVAKVGVPTEVVLKLEAVARVTGKVLDGTKPVPGAQVFAMHPGAFGSEVGVSQSDGSFVLEYVPAGDVAFMAKPFEVDSPTSLHVEAGKTYDGLVLHVHALATIRGRVTRLGKPIAGVEVAIVPTNEPQHVLTDAGGEYELRGVEPGTYSVQAGGEAIGAFALPKTATVDVGQVRTVDFELDMAGTIAGVVVDREGKPVEGVFVRWLHEKTGDIGRCITDALGRYRCGAMTGGGQYRAAVYPSADMQDGYATADGAPYPTLEVKDGRTVIDNVKLTIDRPRLTISGHVLDDTGAPVADVLVEALAPPEGQPAHFNSWLRLPWTSTDADGAFTVRDLTAGRYALQAHAADGSEGVTSGVVAGTNSVTIRIERAGTIEGKLVGFKQAPTVLVRSLTEFKLREGTVDGARFRIAGVRPGRYLVSAQATSEGDARVIDVGAGEVTKADLKSHGQAVIDGTVIDFRTRAPILGATCHAVMSVDGQPVLANWDLGSGARGDGTGRIKIEPAPAGNVTVTCMMAGLRWSPPSADVSVRAGGHAAVQLMSVEGTLDTPSTIGVEFDWNVTAPRISGVVANGPAAKAGIAPGDLVTAVDGVSVQGLNGAGVSRLIGNVPPGDDVRIKVLRGANAKNYSVRALSGL